MPSFDIVSSVDMGELKNALTQAQKEVGNRYDFKGSDASLELKENDKVIEILASNDYQVKAALDILRTKASKRGLGMKTFDPQDPAPTGNRMVKLIVKLNSGIDKEQGKLLNKLVKESGLKLTSSYMDEKIRVTGKSIDDLQQLWAYVKDHKDVKVDLQMENMKR